MVRPPKAEPNSKLMPGSVVFDDIGCVECHARTLKTRADPQFRIQLAAASDNATCRNSHQLGSFAEVDAPVHPAVLMATARRASECTDGSTYCIDLTNPVLGPADPLPAEFYPRLPARAVNGPVTVPLLSDLKRHKMGCFLLQNGTPQADDSGNDIPNDEWLTSKLWGVAANAPWLHDGRARTLRQAILMHNGTDGTGSPAACALSPGGLAGPQPSEAAGSVANFIALTETNKQALVDFLETLTIPVPGG